MGQLFHIYDIFVNLRNFRNRPNFSYFFINSFLFLCFMKRLFFLILLFNVSVTGNSQTDSIPEPPYKRFPTVPPFKILLTDSTTYLTKDDLEKKKSVMIMLFSPDC